MIKKSITFVAVLTFVTAFAMVLLGLFANAPPPGVVKRPLID